MTAPLTAVVCAIVLLCPGTAADAGQPPLQIAYTADLRGNLLPCSCPAAALGGLARRVGWMDSLRDAAAEPLLIVDAGSALPRESQFPLMQPDDFRSLAGLHIEAAERIRYDALVSVPGQSPAAEGPAWMAPDEARLIDYDGLRIALAAVDERSSPMAAAHAITRLGRADLNVLLCAGDLSYAKAAAQMTGAAVVVLSGGACFNEPVWQNGTLFLGPGRDGKYIGLAKIEILPDRTVRLIDMTLRPMDATVSAAPDWQERVEKFVLALERKQPGVLALGE